MLDALGALVVFGALCAAALLGRVLLAWLPATHRTRDTLDHTRTVTGLLVTFAALVLGLLTASVNTSFEKTGSDLQAYAADLIRLTAALEDYGPGTLPLRQDLRRYTAAAIASTWPEEPPPPGPYPVASTDEHDIDSTVLGGLLHGVALRIMALDEGDPVHRALRAAGLARMEALEGDRWMLIGEAHHTITPPFVAVMVFWLFVIFLGFGLNAPPNALAITAIVLVALCVATAFFVLLELDGPLDGLVKVSSEPMHHALRHIDRSIGAAAPG